MNQTPGVKIAIRKNIHCMVLYLYIQLLPSYCPTILPVFSHYEAAVVAFQVQKPPGDKQVQRSKSWCKKAETSLGKSPNRNLAGVDRRIIELNVGIYQTFPDAPCMEYLPTFTRKMAQMYTNAGGYSIHGASGIVNLGYPTTNILLAG